MFHYIGHTVLIVIQNPRLDLLNYVWTAIDILVPFAEDLANRFHQLLAILRERPRHACLQVG